MNKIHIVFGAKFLTVAKVLCRKLNDFFENNRQNSPKEYSPYIYTWYKSGAKNIEGCLNFFPFHIF
jgi:hypothetical protein